LRGPLLDKVHVRGSLAVLEVLCGKTSIEKRHKNHVGVSNSNQSQKKTTKYIKIVNIKKNMYLKGTRPKPELNLIC